MSGDSGKPTGLVRVHLTSAIIAVVFAILVSVVSSVTSGAWWAGELTNEIKHLNIQLEKVIAEAYTRREAEAHQNHIFQIFELERAERAKLEDRVSELEKKSD